MCRTSRALLSRCNGAAMLWLRQGTRGALCCPPQSSRAAKGTLTCGGSLSSVLQGMQSSQAGQGRLLAYKPALKQRAELQVSGSEQLQHVPTGQLSHGNWLLPHTAQAPNRGRGKHPFSHARARGRERAGGPLPRLSRPQQHTNCCGKVQGAAVPPDRFTASVKQCLCPSRPSWGILGPGRAASERNGSVLGAACPFHSNAFSRL